MTAEYQPVDSFDPVHDDPRLDCQCCARSDMYLERPGLLTRLVRRLRGSSVDQWTFDGRRDQ